MRTLKKWILAVAMSSCASAFANTFTADLSDLWYSEQESGWGVNVTQQREVIFLTFFIYGPDGNPHWYTGQTSQTGMNSQGALEFSGNMYEYTGTYYSNPYKPSDLRGRSVGTVTFTAFLDLATISFTIDGLSMNKVVTRQTFRNNDLTGEYLGAMKQVQSGCKAPTASGEFNNTTEFSINHAGSSFSMTARLPDGSLCSYSGNYVQTGRLGRSQGNYSCPGGLTGTYDMIEIEANIQGFTARYIANNNVCTSLQGRLAGMRE